MPGPVFLVEFDSHKGLRGVDASFQNVGEAFPGMTLLAHHDRPAVHNVRLYVFTDKRTHPSGLLRKGQKL